MTTLRRILLLSAKEADSTSTPGRPREKKVEKTSTTPRERVIKSTPRKSLTSPVADDEGSINEDEETISKEIEISDKVANAEKPDKKSIIGKKKRPRGWESAGKEKQESGGDNIEAKERENVVGEEISI